MLVCVFYGVNAPGAQSDTEAAIREFAAAAGTTEVHFSRMRFRQREAFASLLAPLSFRYSSFVANTDSVLTPIAENGSQADALLGLAMMAVFRNATGLCYPHIFMDRDTSPSLALRIKRRLNQALPTELSHLPIVSELQLADSIDYPTIQLADFLAGIIRQRYFPSCKPKEKAFYSTMYEIIRSKGTEASWNLNVHQSD